MITDVADIVDLGRYPISDLEAPEAEELVCTGRRRLAADGVFTLPGFVRPAALAAMQEEADRLCPEAYRRVDHRNGFPAGMGEVTQLRLGCVSYDQMPAESVMRRLFLWDGLTRFVSEVLKRRPYYRSADPIASCMVTELSPGDELGWHFDPNDGIVKLVTRVMREMALTPDIKPSGGGTDANAMRLHGIDCVVVGMSTNAMHTVDEHVIIPDLVNTALFCQNVVTTKA